MDTHFFDPIRHICIVGFLAAFMLACKTNSIYEGRYVCPFTRRWRDAQKLFNVCMCAEDCITATNFFVRSEKPRSREMLLPFSKTVNYFLKKNMTDQPTAENDKAILRYGQTQDTIPQQFAEYFIAKSFQSRWCVGQNELSTMSSLKMRVPSLCADYASTGRHTHKPTWWTSRFKRKLYCPSKRVPVTSQSKISHTWIASNLYIPKP